jgi:hypothetical protein
MARHKPWSNEGKLENLTHEKWVERDILGKKNLSRTGSELLKGTMISGN